VTPRILRSTGCVLALLTGCSGGHQHAGLRIVSPAPGLMVRLPTGSARVTAALAAGATGPLTAPVHLDRLRYPGAIAVLSPARRIGIRGPFLAAGVMLTFRLRRGAAPKGTSPDPGQPGSGDGR
jgi:hypothetical protein